MADCEKYNCNCGQISGQIEAYNSAVDSLSGALDVDGIKDKIQAALQKLEDKLKGIVYNPADTPSDKNPCDQCGSCAKLRELLQQTIGGKQAAAIIACCGPGGNPVCGGSGNAIPDINDGGPNPCGSDADNQRVLSLLPPGCDLFPEDDGETTIKVPKYKCVETPADKCKDKVKIELEKDGEISINIPLLEGTINKVNAVFDYMDSVRKSLNKLQDFGGKINSLKKEGCLVVLLDVLCSSVGGMGHTVANPKSGCGKAISGAKFDVATRDPKSVCDQLMHELAFNHTGTYGHVGNVNPTARPKGGRDWRDGVLTTNQGNGENDKNPNCSENERVRTTSKVFVAAGQNPTDAINAKFEQLKKMHPGGCDGAGLKIDTIKGSVDCGGAVPCDCDPPTPPLMTEEEIKQIQALQAEMLKLENELNAARAELKLAEDALSTLNQLLARGGADTDELRIQIKTLEVKIATIIATSAPNQTRIDEITRTIQELRNNRNNLFGSCVEYQYSFCPANSTPKEGRGGGAGGGGGVTRGKESDHSNFFDLLRQIKDATRIDGSICGNHNPLGDAVGDCFGGQTGKDPTSGFGPDGGPTIGDGDDCSDNDGVNMIPSNGPCNPPESNDRERRNCIVKLQNMANGLFNEINKSGVSREGVIGKLSNLARQLNGIGPAIEGITMPGGAECEGFSVEDITKAIEGIINRIESIKNQAESIDF